MAPSGTDGRGRPDSAAGRFEWKYFSRFVMVTPVQLGWLVIWGRYEDAGKRIVILGNQLYPTLAGARYRLAEAVLDLTRKPDLAVEAAAELDRFPFPPHQPRPLPEPL